MSENLLPYPFCRQFYSDPVLSSSPKQPLFEITGVVLALTMCWGQGCDATGMLSHPSITTCSLLCIFNYQPSRSSLATPSPHCHKAGLRAQNGSVAFWNYFCPFLSKFSGDRNQVIRGLMWSFSIRTDRRNPVICLQNLMKEANSQISKGSHGPDDQMCGFPSCIFPPYFTFWSGCRLYMRFMCWLLFSFWFIYDEAMNWVTAKCLLCAIWIYRF